MTGNFTGLEFKKASIGKYMKKKGTQADFYFCATKLCNDGNRIGYDSFGLVPILGIILAASFYGIILDI